MYKLVKIKQFGFEIEMFAELADARRTFITTTERQPNSRLPVMALFLYDSRDELIMATNVAGL